MPLPCKWGTYATGHPQCLPQSAGHGLGYALRNEERACYEREGVPPDEQYSAIPELEERGVQCWSGHKEGATSINCTCGPAGC